MSETQKNSQQGPVILPAWQFLLPALLLTALIAFLGQSRPLPTWLLPALVIAGVANLFLLGSFRYQFNKNILTFGWLPLEVLAWALERWHQQGRPAPFFAWSANAFGKISWSWQFLDQLMHADTLLFIAALSFFVAAVAQTRALESVALRLVHRRRGHVLSTVLILFGVVALASGILDGVSMVGLLVRTVSIVMMLGGCSVAATRKTVMLAVMITTICGIWLAYGEPPNLIMVANVRAEDGRTLLNDKFFLLWCMPAAVLSFGVIAWELRRVIGKSQIDPTQIDLMERNVATLRFMQTMRFGRMLTDIELVEDHQESLGEEKKHALIRSLQEGHSLGDSLVRNDIPRALRLEILGQCSAPEHSEVMDKHFVARAENQLELAESALKEFYLRIKPPAMQRVRSRVFAIWGLMIFVILLVAHSWTHVIPLFVPPVVGFMVVMAGLLPYEKIRGLALRDASHEVAEYAFLIPLFMAVSLLSWSGFFDRLREPLMASIKVLGPAVLAELQFGSASILSAILDNNVVADFASRLLVGMPQAMICLFAMAQIAGYALGGCWTHVGSAQSVVAFAFVKRDVDETFTPMGWVKEMTGPILKIGGVLLVYIMLAAWATQN